MRLWLRCLLAAAGGLATAAAFEPFAVAWLLVPGVAALSVALTAGRAGVDDAVPVLGSRAAAAVGFCYGLGFMGLLVPWLSVIGVDAWLGLSVLEASFFALLGWLLVRVSRLPAAPLWAAATWVAVESLRSAVPWGGFPWGRLAFGTVDTPWAASFPWAGTAGTSFLVALSGTVLAWLVVRRPRPASAAPAVAVTAALVALPLLAGVPGLEEGDALAVAAVQGDVPGQGMDAFAERRAVLDNHVQATLELAARVDRGEAPAPDLVLWPENSTDIDPFADAGVAADIQRAVDAVGVPTLVGAMVGGPGEREVRNQGIVWEPGTGPGERYSKTHPVPFGEYIPLRAQLARFFERLDQIPRDMVAGTEPGLLTLGPATIGDVICFEVAYDDSVHDVVEGGAGMLVVQTNNATYMGTGQVEQQFAMARLRALQTGRTVVVVATNGVSGVIGPRGEVEQRAPVRETVVLEATVPQVQGVTPGVRLGDEVGWFLIGVALAAQLAAQVGGRRRRADRPDRPGGARTHDPRPRVEAAP